MLALNRKCGSCRSLLFLDDHPGWGCQRVVCLLCSRDSITRRGTAAPKPELRDDYAIAEGAGRLLQEILGAEAAAALVQRLTADDGELYSPPPWVRAVFQVAGERNGAGSAGSGFSAPAAVGGTGAARRG